MKWFHRVNIEWYKARKNYLTASDVAKLWPKTKTGRKRIVSDVDYIKLIQEKSLVVRPEDCESYDWAARGHILEPYAVHEFSLKGPKVLHHWDDCVIYDSQECIGYSPDALDIAQLGGFLDSVEVSTDDIKPCVLGEVKCYAAGKHTEVICTPKAETEERIQIATAMYVSPSIKRAYLILYNPEVRSNPLVYKTWTRDDLMEEIEIVGQIAERWKSALDDNKCKLVDSDSYVINSWRYSIDEIYAAYQAQREREERLNPPCVSY